MIPERLNVSEDDLRAFCEKWQVVEVDLFGSALREDFTEESDVDLLVVYAPDARTTLVDEVRMQEELEAIFGRRVHFMSKRGVEASENYLLRKIILESATPIYVAS